MVHSPHPCPTNLPSVLLARPNGQSIGGLDVSGRQEGWLVSELGMKSLAGGTSNVMETPYSLHKTVFFIVGAQRSTSVLLMVLFASF